MLQIRALNIYRALLCNARAAGSIGLRRDKPSEPAALSLKAIVYSSVTGVAALQCPHLTQKRNKSPPTTTDSPLKGPVTKIDK